MAPVSTETLAWQTKQENLPAAPALTDGPAADDTRLLDTAESTQAGTPK